MEEIAVKLVLDDELAGKFKKSSDDIKKESTKVEQHLNGINETVKKLGVALAGVFAIGKVIEFGKKSIDNYDKQIVAVTKLRVSLGSTSKALLEQASALQEVTRFGDEATIEAQALLAMYGLTEKQILRLTPTIQDMAAATGDDLVSASDRVGRTITSTMNALAREGIVVSESTDKTRRLSEVVGQLNDRYKGQAAAIAAVGRGPLDQLSNKFGDVMENVGKLITNFPIFTAVLTGANKVLDIAQSVTADANTEYSNLAETTSQELLPSFIDLNKELAKTTELAPQAGFALAAAPKMGDKAYIDELAKSFSFVTAVADQTGKNVKERIQEIERQINKTTGGKGTKQRTGKSVEEDEIDKIIAKYKDLTMSDEEMNATLLEQRTQYFDAKREKQLADAELEKKLSQESVDAYNEKAMREKAIDDATIARKKAMADAQRAYDIAQIESGVSIIGSLGAINSALKGNAEASKGLALAQIAINTAVAIMKATAQTGVLAPLAIPAIIASGIAQAATVSAQKFAKGGDFMTNGPQMIMVGDNPGGREHVQVTPTSSPNYNGPKSGNMSVSMGNVYISGNADASTVSALNNSREKQLRQMRQMLKELGYARQTPSFA